MAPPIMCSRHLGLYLSLLLALIVLVAGSTDPIDQLNNARANRMTRKERLELSKKEAEKYEALKADGHVEVDHTKEGEFMRKYQLRNKRRKGVFRKKHKDWASILFPGVAPEVYEDESEVLMYTDLVNSKKTHVPFEFYKLPGCPMPTMTVRRRRGQRKNLGARLQGVELKPAPYVMTVKNSHSCLPLCQASIKPKMVNWLRKLIERQYRIHFTFDGLPVLMRSKELNYAVRGFPLGFVAPPDYTGLDHDEFYLYNHLKFTVTYKQVEGGGVHITGFDVLPISIQHDIEKPGNFPTMASKVSTCDAEGSEAVENDLETYLTLATEKDELPVIYSYEVEWQESHLEWADRWDVYVIGGHNDDIHAFAIINSLMIVLFLTGAIATIMIRTLRKDIAGYNEMQTLEDAQEETGWKLVHGDVFRPPSSHPNIYSILVGTGAQIGSAFFLTMVCSIVGLTNPLKKGQMLTSVVLLYVLCGAVAGYISARTYKFCGGQAWKRNMFLTAAALPGTLISIFTVLNIFLHFVGAATAVHFFTLLAILGLWVTISTPMVFVGSFFGFRAENIQVPVKVNQMARYVPQDVPWFANPPLSYLLGGLLPFGAVCIELFFIMSALWLHQIYYMMGSLLAVLLILVATSAEVSVVMTYLQLCAEDHRWWWKAFFNCASAGFYLFLYSLWFLVSRLQLVGVLPVVVYITYMGMISLCFSLFCGSIGVICSFAFIRSIYGALKVD